MPKKNCLKEQQARPNIVMFYIDDWAWNGSPVAMNDTMENSLMPVLHMPNIQKLANEGMKFRNAYGSPQCAPARVCVQTGQSAPHSGFTVYLGSREPYYDTKREYRHFPLVPNVSDRELDEDAVTIPKALKPLGYVSAHIGKWHMRGDPAKAGYVLHDGATDNNPGNTLKYGLERDERTPRRLPKDMTDPKLMFSITEKAIGFMEEQVKKSNPFYLQISHYAMHAGYECLDKTHEKYVNHPLVQEWYKKNNKHPDTVNRGDDPAIWLGMGEDLDGRIGAVLDKLKELGIEDNTYVIVVGDNGYRHDEVEIIPDYKQPLHATKWWLWDGGIRVPMIVKGPGSQIRLRFYRQRDQLRLLTHLRRLGWRRLEKIAEYRRCQPRGLHGRKRTGRCLSESLSLFSLSPLSQLCAAFGHYFWFVQSDPFLRTTGYPDVVRPFWRHWRGHKYCKAESGNTPETLR